MLQGACVFSFSKYCYIVFQSGHIRLAPAVYNSFSYIVPPHTVGIACVFSLGHSGQCEVDKIVSEIE